SDPHHASVTALYGRPSVNSRSVLPLSFHSRNRSAQIRCVSVMQPSIARSARPEKNGAHAPDTHFVIPHHLCAIVAAYAFARIHSNFGCGQVRQSFGPLVITHDVRRPIGKAEPGLRRVAAGLKATVLGIVLDAEQSDHLQDVAVLPEHRPARIATLHLV